MGYNPEVPPDAVWGDVGYVIPALRSARASAFKRLLVFYTLLVLLIAALLVLVFWLVSPAQAHMKSRPDLTEWLRTLYSVRSPCCDGTDAETLADPDWKMSADKQECVESEPWKWGVPEDFHVCIRLQDQKGEWRWWQVPDSAIVTVPNRAGPSLYWKFWAASGKPFIRCFLPGSLS